ncbi:GNAT family N-acetyltransferase [Anaerosporobacter sp.]|uniref:GNAT family N-acetyltransferase n=1 Tax=Anaerosporobacter sp. TaxID=1872529 RepID=UPI00286F5184|nr:GNAT family N-acetyltransferase [Anaerosporobacter sp.]
MNTIFHKVANQEEINQVVELGATIWREHYSSLISMEQIDYMLDKYQSPIAIAEQMENQGYEYYLIKDDDSTVGYIGIMMEEEKIFLSKLYVAKEARGNGFASKAFAFLADMAAENKKNAIWLTVNRHNDSSVAVYEKKGFVKVREQVADIGNGYVMDDFIMELAVAN